jgi:AcrR family transcriptional regulator
VTAPAAEFISADLDRAADQEEAERDPAEVTREEILAAARQVFSESGLSGARVDDIALLTRKSKRMIYYHFRSKEELFRAVLLDAYTAIRQAEKALRLDGLDPLAALAALVRFTFDYQTTHESFVRLVMAENVNMGRSLELEPGLVFVNHGVRERLAVICARGVAEGVMRQDIDPTDVHLTISSLAFFTASNRYTFSKIFDCDLTSRHALRRRRESVVDTVLRSVATPRAIAAGVAGGG